MGIGKGILLDNKDHQVAICLGKARGDDASGETTYEDLSIDNKSHEASLAPPAI
ncbi:hypothetical protein XANCAGTX0491_004801 [Xanthoria calcicola]